MAHGIPEEDPPTSAMAPALGDGEYLTQEEVFAMPDSVRVVAFTRTPLAADMTNSPSAVPLTASSTVHTVMVRYAHYCPQAAFISEGCHE